MARLFFLLMASLFQLSWMKQEKSNEGRGVVFSMGSKEGHFIGVYATIRLIRQTSKLPVEIWCYPFEYTQIPTNAIKALESLHDVSLKLLPSPPFLTTIDELDLKNVRKGRSWQTDYLHFSSKPLALLLTNLTQVMLLDSDALLFMPPEKIFASSLYTQTGTLFLHDKFIDHWPYKRYDALWMEQFLLGFKRADYVSIPLSHSSVESVPAALLSAPDSVLSQTFSTSSFSKSSIVRTQHLAESSLVLFDKLRQLRATRILGTLTTRLYEEVYRNSYGDKESYWMACELAGAAYSFSSYGPSHWAALTKNQTCPDLVTDPTFVHYYPGPLQEVMSMNQFKYRHVKKFDLFENRGKKQQQGFEALALATSQRQTRKEQIADYTIALKTCDRNIKPMRKLQRCWSSKVQCSKIPEGDMQTLRLHTMYQLEATKIFYSK